MDESQGLIRAGGLVLYKRKPALVQRVGEKIDLLLEGGDEVSVRPKDIVPLHPGPLADLAELGSLKGEVREAWSLLKDESEAGGSLQLMALAELVYGEYSPASAWAAWQLLEDGLYFTGTQDAIQVRSEEAVVGELAGRQARAAEAAAWAAFLERVQDGRVDPVEDGEFLRDVEDLALGRRETSRVLQALGREEDPKVAHAFLLQVGVWTVEQNPYPARERLSTTPPAWGPAALPAEDRRDLTDLPAFAIDDSDNADPDDALSLDADLLWVHVADVAAVLRPDQAPDLEARTRGATLYLPEGAVPMLDPGMVGELGLGLQEISPALSFGLRLSTEGEVTLEEITPSWVRVERTTYARVESRLKEEPFRSLDQIARRFESRRRQAGALLVDLPEVNVTVEAGRVQILPVEPLRSREVVREAMLMAGEAAACFASDHSLPFPFVSQQQSASDPGDSASPPVGGEDDLAAAFAALRTMSRSQVGVHPGAHTGLGLPIYSRVTSPLRRYLDLVAHQQLRAHAAGDRALDEQELLARIGAVESVVAAVGRAEMLSNRHWTLVYLLQNPDWRGEGVLVEQRGARGRVVIPSLALTTWMQLQGELPPNERLPLVARHVNLPGLEAFFGLEGR